MSIITGASGAAMFMDLPGSIYRNDAFFCTPSRDKIHRSISRSDFAQRQEMFVAARNGKSAARLLARLSPILQDARGRPLGMLGFFEAENDIEAVRALFNNATAWLRQQGSGTIIGPIDGDTWHSYRLSTGPFTEPPFLMEPHNPPYYQQLWEGCGFKQFESYYSKYVADIPAAISNTDPIAGRASSRGYKLRTINLNRFDDELRILYDLSKQIFSGNLLYTDISFPEFQSLYQDSRPLLHGDLILFAQTPDGKDIGFVFAVTDSILALRAMRGKRNLISLLKFALLRNRAGTINVKTLGVLPEYRGSGVVLLLMNSIYRRIIEKGFSRANLCLIRDGNSSGRMDGGQGILLRKYLLYQLPENPAR